jgi:ATP-binding cassette subfamily B protein
MVRDRVFTQVILAIHGNTVSLGTGLILLLAAQSMRAGTFTVGDFALFVFYLGFVTDLVRFLGRFLTTYKQARVSFARMQTLMQGAPETQLVRHAPLYLKGNLPDIALPDRSQDDQLQTLRVAGLTYVYPESRHGIIDITFEIRKGSLTVITGRIGAGKTTLLRALLGLLPKDSGKAWWNNTLIDDAAEFFVPPRAAYTPQVPQLFSASLGNNISLGLPLSEARIARAIQAAVLERDVAAFPLGLQTLVGPKGVRLSGGQALRTAAARAFVREPELLLVDDLSSALDVATEAALWERLLAQEETTYLVVSHRHAILRRAHHILVLNNGQIDAQGTLDELLESNEEMQRLWRGDFNATTT